jgi:peptidoglycan/LPS O-acetylase OafA/YrhL
MNLSNWFLRIAVVYLLAGVGLGIFMGASGDHSMFPLHAHINLLGWVSMLLFGVFYRLWPQAASSKLARVHFWLYMPSVLAQMALLAAVLRGHPEAEPMLGVASILVAAAMVCFAVVVWKETSSHDARSAQLKGSHAAA